MTLTLRLLGEPTTLLDLAPGSLFFYENTLCVKSEYRTQPSGAIEAFIVGSGEMLWGGTNSAYDQWALEVQPVRVVNGTCRIDLDADAAGSAGLRMAIDAVLTERASQDAKWGVQNHDLPYWTGILGEEFGELCQAVNETVFNNGPAERKKGGYENMRREAVQVAAVAVAFVELLDRQYGR